MEQLLRQGLRAQGLPEDGVPALLAYADALIETNKVMNLTAITEPAEIATLHFLDSTALLGLADFRKDALATARQRCHLPEPQPGVRLRQDRRRVPYYGCRSGGSHHEELPY